MSTLNNYTHVTMDDLLKVSNKPTLPRYTPTFFGGMAPYTTGMFVRHCDHLQVVEACEKQYCKAVERTEVVKDQLERMTTLKESYNKNANKYHRDIITLKTENDKLRSIGFKNLFWGIAIGAVIMFVSIYTK